MLFVFGKFILPVYNKQNIMLFIILLQNKLVQTFFYFYCIKALKIDFISL